MAKKYGAKFLKDMRTLLLDKRAELFGKIDTGQRNLRSSEGHHLADVEDLASDASDEATAYEILEVERRELEQIDLALRALNDGTYGVCDECGKKIAEARLRALPFATTCIECKRRLESSGDIDDEDE